MEVRSNGGGSLRFRLSILASVVLGLIFPIFLLVIGAGLLVWGVRAYRASDGGVARYMSVVAMLVGIGLVLFALFMFFGLMTADVSSVETAGTSGVQGS